MSGLDYAWNRYYSSTWGRFASADPYVMSGGMGNPQGWNRYSYVENNPTNKLDPSGLFSTDPCYELNGWQYQIADPGLMGIGESYGDRTLVGFDEMGGEVHSPLPTGLVGPVQVDGDQTHSANKETKEDCVKRVKAEQQKKWLETEKAIHHATYEMSKLLAVAYSAIGAVVGASTGGLGGAVFWAIGAAPVGFITPYPYGDVWMFAAAIVHSNETNKRIESECP